MLSGKDAVWEGLCVGRMLSGKAYVWEGLCVGSHKGMNSQLWKEFDWNLKIRIFNTPFLISKYVQGPSVTLCWRKCRKIGDHTHIFWDCPVIEGFWKSVHSRGD